ncbi:type II secretion system inner membrane protein GspF [Gynuella sunshinyii]|uniref:Type II secretory pathway, component PulF n=1 Tax=Gynuella sunshinyii YC6258 TaxID=1445510 RepID=A0A0C5V933_9GAMM|nr:type II secretion system inner membrane protein GspF [Gynuella sunshinyii]AJQ95875.1 type II secretory pathway, component PulF [Gynuella sunshinyii YC6258]
MAAFDYIAIDEKGKRRKGVLEGDSPRQIRQMLRDKGWFPAEVELVKEKGGNASLGRKGPSVSSADLALLTRQLATLVGSGMPLEECLKAVAEQSESAKIRSMMMAVRGKVLEGHTLAQAFGEYPRAFPHLYRATVDAGEQSGHLEAVMDKLADYVEGQDATKKSIQMAAVYPTILVVIAFSIVVYLLNTVVPKILDVFISSNQELPKPTQILLSVSDFVRAYWLGMVVLVILLIFFNIWWGRTPGRKKIKDRFKLKLPLIGKMIKGFSTARFASTLATLGSSGVPLVDAMRIASQVIGNLEIQEKVTVATQKVSEGESLNKSLAATGYFPPMMIHMIASGEASGDLERMLERTANTQERTLKELISTMLTLLEPLMLVVMGMIVMLIVMAVVLPIAQLNSNI